MTAKPIAVIYADGHLADRAWTHRPIGGDSYYSLKQIVSAAIALEVPIVGAGDLIDKHRNTARPIYEMHKELDRLAAVGLHFFHIQGQHEFDDVPWFNSHRAAVHIHRCSIDIGPFMVYGLDYQPAGELQQELGDIPEGTDILFGHQVWGNFMGSIASPQGGAHDVPVVHTMFTGDYHVNADIKVQGKDGQDLRVISPGSVCMQSIDEPVDKYFYVLHDDGSWERRKLKTRRMIDSTLILSETDMEFFVENIAADLEKCRVESAKDKLPEEIRTPLLRVNYSHRIQGVKRRVMKLVGDEAHIFWKEKPPEKLEAQERLKERRESGRKHATTLQSKLPEFLEQTNQKMLLKPCQRLLQCGSVEEELRRMREEVFADE